MTIAITQVIISDRNEMTYAITWGSTQIILITIYDEFSPSEFKERKLQVDDMIYNPSLTTDTISNKIQEYQNLCILLANP